MRVLVGHEQYGHMRAAFRRRGFDAWSCDLMPARDHSRYHLQCDVMTVLDQGWDLGIFQARRRTATNIARAMACCSQEKAPPKRGCRELIGQLGMFAEQLVAAGAALPSGAADMAVLTETSAVPSARALRVGSVMVVIVVPLCSTGMVPLRPQAR